MNKLRFALMAGAMYCTSAQAGLILIAGRFEPDFTTGYAYASAASFGDTSGDVAGDLVHFNISAITPSPKTLTFTTPVYGTLTDTFTHFNYLTYTPAGEFYELTNATGYLAVNIIYPGHGISSFSFSDYATVPTPPPPCLDCNIPPPCLTCDQNPNPPIVIGAPEPSTWAMMLLGFVGLGLAAYRRRETTLRLSVI